MLFRSIFNDKGLDFINENALFRNCCLDFYIIHAEVQFAALRDDDCSIAHKYSKRFCDLLTKSPDADCSTSRISEYFFESPVKSALIIILAA